MFHSSAAVAFATILAVVSGLVLTGASAISHDIYGEILNDGKLTEKQQVIAARTGSISIAVISIILALFAQSLNVSFLVSFAFCIGASANLPVIIYTIYWKKFNSNGAVCSNGNRFSIMFSTWCIRSKYLVSNWVTQSSLVIH